MQTRKLMFAVMVCIAAGACTRPADHTQSGAVAAAQTLTASGAATQLQRLDIDSNLAWAASVVQLDTLGNEANGGVKLFGVAGGDPAMNGLHTYIAFYENPAEGWRIFELGDFLNYRVLSEAPGRVDLEITESTMDEAAGAIGSRTRFVILSWTPGENGAPPTTISVTPART